MNPELLRDIIRQYELGHNAPRPNTNSERFWLPVPFNISVHRGIPSALKHFNSQVPFQHLWASLGREAPNVEFSWMCRVVV